MASKTISENPKVTDTVIFELETPDADGCFFDHPYQVRNVTIYYIERSFVSTNFGDVESRIEPADLASDLADAKEAACDDPTAANLAEVMRLQEEVDFQATKETSFYNEAIPVAVIGDENFPAWLNPDNVPTADQPQVEEDNRLTVIEEDEYDNTQYGHFQLEWEPVGQREGTYVICWSWYPLIVGDPLRAHQIFTLSGNTATTTSIPTHFTQEGKYEILLDRYLPEMFKTILCEGDLTRKVLGEFNNSVAAGFTFVEDLANQTIDLIDANAVQESFLPLLGNLFNLKLKSGDPTLWRRQIKTAIPLFKKKGTLSGLQDALGAAGMKLNSLTRMWQVISDYTHQELFDVESDDQTTFTLSEVAVTPIDPNNFELRYRGVEDSEWTDLTSDYVDISTSDGTSTMTWVGDSLSMDPVILEEGDSIRVLYETTEVPASEQAVEDYIRSLPLSDQRDERDQEYPLNNWNVRLIEENDPLFDVVIPTRHPYVDPLVYGQIRTEIPYSENIYNMEEYNGSTRDSKDPCDIDKGFLDPCGKCQASKINVDIEIEELSNDRVSEAQEVIREYVPFHNLIHTITFSGGVNEFIQAHNDDIEVLIQYAPEDFTISGNAQTIFSRTMTNTEQITRNALADGTAVITSASGTAYNNSVVIFAPDVRFDQLGINENTSILEVFSPSANAGTYEIGNVDGKHADITDGTVSESPLNKSQFTFRLSQDMLGEVSGADIYQDDLFEWSDENVDYAALGVKSDWDVDNDADYTGGPWKIEITSSGSGTYTIHNVLPDGSLLLNDPSETLPKTDMGTGIYSLLDDDDEVIATSTTGVLDVTRRGRIDFSGAAITYDDVRNLIKRDWYFVLSSSGAPTGTQWRVTGFTDGDGSSLSSKSQFYIADYTSGDNLSVDSLILNRIVDNEVGNFGYKGIMLEGASNHETGLPILNGANAVSEDDQIESDEFKENYLVLIDNTYYSIAEIDGSSITLAGQHSDWTTLSSGGTSVTYDIWQFTKNGADIPERSYPPMPGQNFTLLDRRGNEVIEVSTETGTPMMFRAAALNSAKQNEVIERTEQNEGITFSIEWADGSAT